MSNVIDTHVIKTNIYSNRIHIGTGLLKNRLGSMGEMFGEFVPNENYHLVKKDIQELCNLQFRENSDFSSKWSQLRLNAQLESGYFLFAIGSFWICDLIELQNDPIEITLSGILPDVFDDSIRKDEIYIVSDKKEFLPLPWQKISIGEKIAFEDELKKEITLAQSPIYPLFNETTSHKLTNTVFSALAKNPENDDVVFSIHGEAKGFIAIVHLTWSGKAEKDTRFPWTNLYQSLEEIIEINE